MCVQMALIKRLAVVNRARTKLPRSLTGCPDDEISGRIHMRRQPLLPLVNPFTAPASYRPAPILIWAGLSTTLASEATVPVDMWEELLCQ